MLDTKIAQMINDQINAEFVSAYLYLDFANYYEDQGLDGFANWYYVQAQEERDHAMLMRTYLLDNGEQIHFTNIEIPVKEYKSIEDPLHYAMEHEQYITDRINKIYGEAHSKNDYRTMQFYDWFVKEQCEEEKNADDLIKKFSLFGHDPKGLYEINQELLARTYVAANINA